MLRWAIVAGFAFGTATHAADVVRYGWSPYEFGPRWLNGFWNALVLLDAGVIILLRARPRVGYLAGLTVMIADVAANGYAAFGLGISGFDLALPLQTAFLALVAAAALLQPGRRDPAAIGALDDPDRRDRHDP